MASNKDQFLAELVALHGVPLEKFLARKLDNPEDAAEVAQDAFLRLHRMQEPETLDNARAFLFQVANNLGAQGELNIANIIACVVVKTG